MQLQNIIKQRWQEQPENSYTTQLFQSGIKRIAQKVGEEGVEVGLAAVGGEELMVSEEAADLLFHLLVLLEASDQKLDTVIEILRKRHK